MTETREVDYARLAASARKLFTAIHAQMDIIENRVGHVQPDAWFELHDLSKIAAGLQGQLARIDQREREADAPVPYLPADHDDCQDYADWIAEHAPIGDGS